MKRKTRTKTVKVEKIQPKDRCCKKCKYGYLMQNRECDPIVAECIKTKERFVAISPHFKDCGFEKRNEEIVIHEMIKLTK